MRTINKNGVAAARMVQVGEKIQVWLQKCEKNVWERYMWFVVAYNRKGATSNRFYFVAWMPLFKISLPLKCFSAYNFFCCCCYSFVLVVILSSLHKYQHCTDIAWFLKLHWWARRQPKYYSEDAGYPPICRTHIRSWFRFELEVNIIMFLAWEQWLFTLSS